MTIEDAKERMIPVLKRHDVRRAAVFGSLARGEAGEQSDVDLLVELAEGKTLFDLGALKLDLEDALGRRVDLLTYGGIHPLFEKRVLAEQVTIHERV
ncbi:MAG: nucleotidyltransferase family protein [Bacillota bacterium]|nr:nucleotidyltransferase family protein [Bacillota bacterium]